MPVVVAWRIGSGLRRTLVLLALTAGLLVLGALVAATAHADEHEPVGDALSDVAETAGLDETPGTGDESSARDPLDGAADSVERATGGSEDRAAPARETAADEVTDQVSAVLDAPARAVAPAAGEVAGPLGAPADLERTTTELADAPAGPADRIVGTANEVAGALDVPVTVAAEVFPAQEGDLAEVTVAVARPGSDTLAAGPGTAPVLPAAAALSPDVPVATPSARALPAEAAPDHPPAARPIALPSGASNVPARPAVPTGAALAPVGGSTADAGPPRRVASLPGGAPSPSGGGGNGAAAALLPLAALLVPPTLLRRLRHARAGRVVSLCPIPGERPG